MSHLQACYHHFVFDWLLDFLQWIVIYRFRNIQAQALPGLISGVSLVSASWQCCCYHIMLLVSTKNTTTWLGWDLARCSAKPCVNYIFGSEMRVCVCQNAFSHMCWHMCVLTHKQTDMHTMHTQTHINSISSVERCNSSSGMRSTQENGSLLWCVPPAQSTQACNDMHTQPTASTTLNQLGTNVCTYLQQETLRGNANVQLQT